MQLQQAQRQNVKIKLGLQGCSGSGKTYSSLLLAYGLVNDWKQIVIIDTENQSASLYTHLGNFYTLNLKAPFSPERYIQAIKVCTEAQMQVIIIDSLSMEWEFILEVHAQLTGNSYTNWSKFTPRHQQLIQAILQADAHVICTLRAKQDYVLNEKNGKQVPEKVGMKPIQREGTDYELTLVFELDIKHNAIATKDRTGLFMGQPESKITLETGRMIANWCQLGISATKPFHEFIQECETIDELRELYLSNPEFQQSHLSWFNQRKAQLQPPVNLVSPQNHSSNGTATHQ